MDSDLFELDRTGTMTGIGRGWGRKDGIAKMGREGHRGMELQ